jgi:hypothetical protein
MFKLKKRDNLTQVFVLTREEGIHAMGVFRRLGGPELVSQGSG